MLVTLGALTLVAGIEPKSFQARSCLSSHRANNSSGIEYGLNADRKEYFYPVTEYLVNKP